LRVGAAGLSGGGSASNGAAKPWSAYANDPRESAIRQQLIPQLREHLKSALPDYMIPSIWMLLKQLPLNSNGKVDRRALPAPQARFDDLGEYIAPRTSLERLLADIWAAVLQVDQVGVRDNFFELGGHSLLAMQVVVRIRSQLSIDLPMRTLFEFPTIEQMSVRVDELRHARLVYTVTAGNADMEELLERVASMSDAQVQEFVRQKEVRP